MMTTTTASLSIGLVFSSLNDADRFPRTSGQFVCFAVFALFYIIEMLLLNKGLNACASPSLRLCETQGYSKYVSDFMSLQHH